jgi:hypothetical protein
MSRFGSALAVLTLVVAAVAPTLTTAQQTSPSTQNEKGSVKMKYFIDVHDRANKTFPEKISKQEFAGFFAKFEAACREEGVVLLRIHVSLEDGRAYCLTSAPNADAVRRAHQRVGLPFDRITEVTTTTPGDLFLAP